MNKTTQFYSYQLINQIGTYTSYLAIVAAPQNGGQFLFNLSVLFTARYAGGAIAVKWAPALLARFGNKVSLLIGNVLSALLLIVIGLYSDHVPIVAVLLFVIGFLGNWINTAFFHEIGSSLHESKLAKINHNLQILEYITMIVGASLGGSLIQFFDLRTAFFVDALSFFLSGLIALSFTPSLASQVASSLSVSLERPFAKLGKNISPSIFSVLIIEASLAVLAAVFNFIEIPFYLKVLGLSYSQIGPFFSVTIIGLVLASYLVRTNRVHVDQLIHLLSLSVIVTILFGVLTASSNIIVGATILLLYIGACSITGAAVTTQIQKYAPPSQTAVYLSLRSSLRSASNILVTPAIGVISNHFGIISIPPVTALVILMVLFGQFVFLRKRLIYEV